MDLANLIRKTKYQPSYFTTCNGYTATGSSLMLVWITCCVFYVSASDNYLYVDVFICIKNSGAMNEFL